MPKPERGAPPGRWLDYYRWTAKRPPRELLLQTLQHIEWEGGSGRGRTAVDLGFGAGTDTLELLRRGWRVVAIDREEEAARFLVRRVPPRFRSRLTVRVAPMEALVLPPADLVYASFSLPFCEPARFPELWRTVRSSVRPRGHFAGHLFGDQDEWHGQRPMSFHTRRRIRDLTRGWRLEMLRETVEEGQSYGGPKHWHFFDVILEKPPTPRKARRP